MQIYFTIKQWDTPISVQERIYFMVVNFRRNLFTITTSNLYTSVAPINVQDRNTIGVHKHGPKSSGKGSIQCLFPKQQLPNINDVSES